APGGLVAAVGLVAGVALTAAPAAGVADVGAFASWRAFRPFLPCSAAFSVGVALAMVRLGVFAGGLVAAGPALLPPSISRFPRGVAPVSGVFASGVGLDSAVFDLGFVSAAAPFGLASAACGVASARPPFFVGDSCPSGCWAMIAPATPSRDTISKA